MLREKVSEHGMVLLLSAPTGMDYYPKDGFQKENGLTRQEALKAMTIWAAYGAFEENEKGSLEAGKFADFVVLEKDIMTIPEKELFGKSFSSPRGAPPSTQDTINSTSRFANK